MRIRTKRWARPELEACRYFIPNPKDYKNKWQSLFLKEQPIRLDLGCGKGVFLAELAYRNPDINFIGVDISMDILGVARRNIHKRFDGKPPENLLLTSANIEYCSELFGPCDNISEIYICFCNPWQKNRHKKRRLTYPTQLKQYKTFLPKNGKIYFKTDDDGLFKDSKKYFEQNGFSVCFSTSDLPKDGSVPEMNILSEHEMRFREQGIPIKAIIVCSD